ncbi:hypothetical protein [Phormidesmis sp. 146-33]
MKVPQNGGFRGLKATETKRLQTCGYTVAKLAAWEAEAVNAEAKKFIELTLKKLAIEESFKFKTD